MRPSHFLTLLLIFGLFSLGPAYGQVTGVPQSGTGSGPTGTSNDTLYVFTPVRPLIDSNRTRTDLPGAFGFNFLFSNSGYGVGAFYEKKFAPSFSGLIDFGITAARNRDEFEEFNFDPNSVHYRTAYVPNKVNRVWHAPVMLGVKKGVFEDVFFQNFRPFINGGAGGSVVLTTPYDQKFLSAFSDGQFYFVPGGFVGIGAEFTEKSPGAGFNIRYYYLPSSQNIESMKDEPITDFGGLFLTLNIPLF